MNRTSAVVGVVCAGVLVSWAASSPRSRVRAAAAEAAPRVTVVAELFTSEGCSSCPPADEVLTRLAGTQPVPGVEVIALGEHVDYWDRLGWRDPFSSASFTSRQSEYGARAFGTGSIYTPQIVVDGRFEGVGSDFNAIRKHVLKAAEAPRVAVTVSAQENGDAVVTGVRIETPETLVKHEAADVMLVVTEDRLVTHVRKGENGGRTLTHSAVVRSLMTIGALPPGREVFSMTASTAMAAEWKHENVRFAAFVQERQSRRILGAASVALQSPQSR